MPYEIVVKGSGYVVRNRLTGKEYAKKAMSRAMALRQLKLLRMVEHGGTQKRI